LDLHLLKKKPNKEKMNGLMKVMRDQRRKRDPGDQDLIILTHLELHPNRLSQESRLILTPTKMATALLSIWKPTQL
jgi:hypothetical protein